MSGLENCLFAAFAGGCVVLYGTLSVGVIISVLEKIMQHFKCFIDRVARLTRCSRVLYFALLLLVIDRFMNLHLCP